MIDKPAVAEADAGLDVHADFVGAAMMLRLVHAGQQFAARSSRRPRMSKSPTMPHIALVSGSVVGMRSRRCRTRNGSITGAMPDEGTV